MNKHIKAISKNLLAIIGIGLLSAGCFGGGSSKVQEDVVINIWKPFEDSEHLEPLFQAYMQAHPHVQIVYTKKNIDNYESDLINALASGTGPDIFSINNSWLPKYIDKVTPAPDAVFTYKDYKDAFVDVAVKDFVKDNKIYGVPLAVDSLALYYNKDLMGTAGIATPPKTWNELSQDVQRITRNNRGTFIRSGVAMGTNKNVNRAVDIMYLLMLQKGAVPFSEDLTTPTFGEGVQKNGNFINAGEEALNFYTSFANPSNPNYTWNNNSDYSIDSFVNGRSAFLYSYSYTRDTIKQKAPNLNYDIAPVPQPNLDDPAVNFANYWGEAVSKQSKNADVAWDILKQITSKKALDMYYAQNKQPSSRKDLIELQIQDPEIGVFANANLTAKSFYKPDQQKMDTIFGKMIDDVILSGLTTQDSLNNAEDQASLLGRPQY